MRAGRAAVAAAVSGVLLVACSGQRCEDLPALRAERDAARAAYLDLARSGKASPAETEQADGELHALERRVDDIEQSCERR